MQLERTLICRPTHVHLQHKIYVSQTRRIFAPAARSLSTRRDAVAAAQDIVEDTDEDTFDATRQTPAHETPLQQDVCLNFTRRDFIRGVIGGTVATGAPALLPDGPGTPSAAAIPITSRLPPIGQAAPGTYNIGVAAVRDPGLYRLGWRPCSCSSMYIEGLHLNFSCQQGHGNRSSCQE